MDYLTCLNKWAKKIVIIEETRIGTLKPMENWYNLWQKKGPDIYEGRITSIAICWILNERLH